MLRFVFLALISGLVFAVSWPTYGIPYFIWVAFVPLLLMENRLTRTSPKRSGWKVLSLSYISFLIWNLVTTGWLYQSKAPDGQPSLAAVLLPVLLNSLFMAVCFWGYHQYRKVQGSHWALFFFVTSWMSFEKLHLEWEISWPWLNLGNAFSEHPELIQFYEYVGATGGSLWILLVNVFVFYSIRHWEASRNRKALMKQSLLTLLLISVPIGISLYRYHTIPLASQGPSVRVALIQPELDPYKEKYTRDSLDIVNELISLSKEVKNPEVILTPETSFPGRGSIDEMKAGTNGMFSLIQKSLSKGSVFVGGTSTHRFYDGPYTSTATPIGYGKYVDQFNSVVRLSSGQQAAFYHKSKFVPGVEIFPYMSLMRPILGDLMLDFGGSVVSLGCDNTYLNFKIKDKVDLAPLICYESIYGEHVNGFVKEGASLLGISTNDSWWGYSEGHRQLLSYARLRAIETRREIVRSANSGTSAHINIRGDLLETLPYGARGAIAVTAGTHYTQTLYTYTGDIFSRLCLLILGFIILYPSIYQLIMKKKKNLKSDNLKEARLVKS